MSQDMEENISSVLVAYPPVKFPIKKEFIEPEELEMEDEGLDSAKSNGGIMDVDGESNEGSGHSSLIDYHVETAGESSDEEPLLKEKEENQHPIAYAPVKFKQYIKQEPEDEEQCRGSNVTEDLTQEDAESIEGMSNHSSLDGVETADELADEGPLPSSSTTIASSAKGKSMEQAHKTRSHPKQKGTPRSAALERPFKCDKCEKIFKCKDYLTDHLKRTCGKERSFLCKQCDSRFKRRSHLKRHLTAIHKIGSSQLTEFGAGPQDRPVMPFKCNQCDRSYTHQKSLHDHLRNACGKDPTFFCNQCEFRTKWKQNLKAHVINVHDIKRSQFALFGAGPTFRPVMAFKCDQCEHTYKNKSSLQRHMKKHSPGAKENSDGF